MQAGAGRVVVVGGVGLDVVAETSRLPAWGDDLRVQAVRGRPGGKGLNQSVALARLGATVRTIAAVGDDGVGRDLLATLVAEGVDVSAIVVRSGASTPICVVMSHPDGRNAFCWRIADDVALTVADVRGAVPVAWPPDAVLVNFDPDFPAVRAGFEMAANLGAALVVNPAPPPNEGDADLLATVGLPWQLVSLATPNEKEARLMLGAALGVQVVADVESIALAELFATTFGVPMVCVTLSERGCVVHDAGGSRTYPAAAAQVVDTTAASDALTAALTVGLLAVGWQGGPAVTISDEIVTGALEAAAWTVGRRGAYDALPTVADLSFRTVVDL